MLLASEKLKSQNKHEFISGVVLNLLFFALFGQVAYYFLNDGNINRYEILNIIGSLFNALIGYLFLADANYFKKHIGTFDWYKNKLQIKYNMEDNVPMAISIIASMIIGIIFLLYMGANITDRLKYGEWSFNTQIFQFYITILIVNTYLLVSYHYIGQVVILQEQILEINDVTDLTSKEKEDFKHEISDFIRNYGVLRRNDLSNFVLKMEKEYKKNKFRNNGEYSELLDKYK